MDLPLYKSNLEQRRGRPWTINGNRDDGAPTSRRRSSGGGSSRGSFVRHGGAGGMPSHNLGRMHRRKPERRRGRGYGGHRGGGGGGGCCGGVVPLASLLLLIVASVYAGFRLLVSIASSSSASSSPSLGLGGAVGSVLDWLSLLGWYRWFGRPRDPVYVNREWRILRDVRSRLTSGGRDVPAAFPLSIRNEAFETVRHPVNGDVGMNVPGFWIPPGTLNERGMLMTRKVASLIGSQYLHRGDAAAGVGAGKSNLLHQRTIFVGLASFRDEQCRHTVEDIFEKATYPKRIRVGVVDQIDDERGDASCGATANSCREYPDQALCKYGDRIDVYQLDARLSTGPSFAGNLVQRMYRGEYYALQAGGVRMSFARGWDVDLVSEFESLGNEMAVLSAVPGDFDDYSSMEQRHGQAAAAGDFGNAARPILCNAAFEGPTTATKFLTLTTDNPDAAPTEVSRGLPVLQPFLTSELSFSRGHFVLNVPHDAHLDLVLDRGVVDVSLSVRAFSHGYDSYAPERPVCFRRDPVGGDGGGGMPRTYMENANLYPGAEAAALRRMIGVIKMTHHSSTSEWNHEEEETYGIGKVREVEKFYSTFGIHVQERVTEKHLCTFVSMGKMHKLFHDSLRPDGMGIDYSNIHFRFHELLNVHELLD